MEVGNGLFVYNSRIDPDYQVFVIYEENDLYPQISEEMDRMDTICIMDIKTNFMIIDGEAIAGMDMDHLLCIESHEIAHVLLDQSGLSEEEAEIESDLVGIFILETMGFEKASMILKKRLYDLRDVEYTKETLLEKIGQIRLDKIIEKFLE